MDLLWRPAYRAGVHELGEADTLLEVVGPIQNPSTYGPFAVAVDSVLLHHF